MMRKTPFSFPLLTKISRVSPSHPSFIIMVIIVVVGDFFLLD